MNEELFQPKTKIGQVLWFLWDMVDISENMHRSERYFAKIRNGIPALLHCIVFAVLFLAFLALTWYFDLQSTLQGLSNITNLVVPNLPNQAVKFGPWIVVVFTFVPTFLELFTAGAAKENIKIIQVAIISFTLFDMITDIPRAYALSLNMWPQIELMGWGLSHITYWLYFFFILFFATLGFEVMTVLFGYAAFSFFWKAFGMQGSIDMHKFSSRFSPSSFASAGSKHTKDEKIVILDG